MGGYGALTLAFRHPEVFGSVYALSPCCTALVADFGASNPEWRELGKLKSPEEVPAALRNGHFFEAADTALDAALAPDPSAPTFGDAPFVVRNGELQTNPEAFSRIAMNLPANMVFPLLPNILRLHGIFFDYGAQDNFSHISIGAQQLAAHLSEAGVTYTLEVYQGDHGSHIADRIQNHLIPWISTRNAP
jgi:pimeloyl-ACP methyl ester carboxylesterase